MSTRSHRFEDPRNDSIFGDSRPKKWEHIGKGRGREGGPSRNGGYREEYQERRDSRSAIGDRRDISRTEKDFDRLSGKEMMNGDESHWPSCPLPLIDVDCEGLRGKEAVERVWFFDLASPTRLIFLAYRSSWFFWGRGRGQMGSKIDG